MFLIIGLLLIDSVLGLFTDCTGVVKSGWVMTSFSIFDTSGIFFEVFDAVV